MSERVYRCVVREFDPNPGNLYSSAVAFLLMLRNCHGFRRYKLVRDERGDWREEGGRLVLRVYTI